MNRRNKSAAKKIDFEPKIPTAQEIEQENIKQKAIQQINNEQKINVEDSNNSSNGNVMKGIFAPKSFFNSKEFNSNISEFIFNLPDFFTGDCSFVQFSDNSFAIKMGEQIFECDNIFIGDSMVVEMEDKIRKISNPEFILNVYEK
jgi:hypothetical protein